MSQKTKKSTQKQSFLSPENYIRQKAQTLPIAECFITPKWQDCGECNVLVARQHTNGNYTIGIYLIDTYCLGVKNAGYRFNISEYEYTELKEGFDDNFEPTTYDEAHNIIYGALAYAEDLGFSPHKDFAVAKYILEEDTDNIPLIEYRFGCNGQPMLIVNTRTELNRYLPTLKRAVGDDYTVLVREEEDEDYDDDDYDDDDYDDDDYGDDESKQKIRNYLKNLSDDEREDFLRKMSDLQKRIEKSRSLPHTPYNYRYPDYPQTLDLKHKELKALFDAKNNDNLDKKTLDTILSLPRETLIKDLEHCILYETGRNCREISKKNDEEDLYGSITHALYLLAEVKATESLPAVLEVMRQNDEFLDFFFNDSVEDVLAPVLYQLAKNQLPALLAYLKEPNLNVSFKIVVLAVFEMTLRFEPERRSEIIALYDDILDFLFENINNTAYYDAKLAGVLIHFLMNICAKELLPKIKCLLNTGLVDDMYCGDYENVKRQIKSGVMDFNVLHEVTSIYEIYK